MCKSRKVHLLDLKKKMKTFGYLNRNEILQKDMASTMVLWSTCRTRNGRGWVHRELALPKTWDLESIAQDVIKENSNAPTTFRLFLCGLKSSTQMLTWTHPCDNGERLLWDAACREAVPATDRQADGCGRIVLFSTSKSNVGNGWVHEELYLPRTDDLEKTAEEVLRENGNAETTFRLLLSNQRGTTHLMSWTHAEVRQDDVLPTNLKQSESALRVRDLRVAKLKQKVEHEFTRWLKEQMKK